MRSFKCPVCGQVVLVDEGDDFGRCSKCWTLIRGEELNVLLENGGK